MRQKNSASHMPTLSSNIVKREVASVQDVEEALARQSLHGGDLVTNLLELARVDEGRLTHVLAESLGLEAAPSGELPCSPEDVRRLVPGELLQRHSLYPLERTERSLVIAVSEPLPGEVSSDLEFSLGLVLIQRAATLVRVQQAVCRDYGFDVDRRVARVLAALAGQPAPLLSARSATAKLTRTQSLRPVSKPASRPALDPRPVVDLGALARADQRARRKHRRLGPYTASMAESDLFEAETRDDVMGAFFDFASQYFDYSALFAVHGDLAEGRDAHGSGASRAKVLALGVPLDLPSTLASATADEPYRLARLSASGLDGALAKDLERRPGASVLLLPVRVRERAVLVLYGDHGVSDVQLQAVGDVISFAPLVAAALERVILRRKGHALPPQASVAGLWRGKPRTRQKAPTVHDRASALASALAQGPLETARISSPAEGDTRASTIPAKETPHARDAGAVARPVISVGASARGPTPPQGMPIPRQPALPREAHETRGVLVKTPLFGTTQSLPPSSPTPVPSSFAPGAPPQPALAESPHTVPPVDRRPLLGRDEDEDEDDIWDTSESHPAAEVMEPSTKPGVGSYPPARRAFSMRRNLTPVQMPPPAPRASDPRYDPPDRVPTPTPDSVRKLELVPESDPAPELQVHETDDLSLLELLADDESAPRAAPSRALAHSARPLPLSGHSEELRLPAVIVDFAQDTEELVQRAMDGDAKAAERLVQVGAAAVPALVGAFPGPILSELRRAPGDGPPRASECGPLLTILARIGPRAAGVLSVRTNDGQPAVRAWATRMLGEMPCPDAARAVARRFVDEDQEVRRAALAAGRMLQAQVLSGSVLAETLSEMLLDSTRRDTLSHMVIEAIADLREARAIPALAALLASGSAEVQRSAHWALVVLARTDYGDNAAAWDHWWRINASRHRIEWLIDALMHESSEIRRAAGDELKSLTKEYFGYYDDLPARERERAQQRYREWWNSKGKARFSPSA